MLIQIILEGIGIGVALSILLGPIFIALTQTGIQFGLRAGLILGMGIWISDFIVIFSCWTFLHSLKTVISGNGFQLVLGITGSLILFISGISTTMSNKKIETSNLSFHSASVKSLFIKGFAVNFINPFTFIFWTGIITSYLQAKGYSEYKLSVLLGSIMGTIIVTDSSKVILAKTIRNYLNEQYQRNFIKISGIVLMIFGIILFFRVIAV